jgi:hypothetical protein
MREVTNNTMQSISLNDGTILAAAGHAGSTKPVPGFDASEENAEEKQKRFETQLESLVESGAISVNEKSQLRAVPPQPAAPKATEDAAEKIAAADDAKAKEKK